MSLLNLTFPKIFDVILNSTLEFLILVLVIVYAILFFVIQFYLVKGYIFIGKSIITVFPRAKEKVFDFLGINIQKTEN